MKFVFAGLILLHGALHLLGFLKAYQLAPIDQLTTSISRPLGLMWLLAAVWLIATALLYVFHSPYWWIPAILGLLVSINLILNYWSDAKWGMVPNLVLLLALVLHFTAYQFKTHYIRDVKQSFGSNSTNNSERVLSMNDLSALPDAVKKYIMQSGFVGKPIIKNFRAISTGTIRKNETSAWIPLSIEQYNLIDPLTRLFFMTGFMKGLPIAGYHRFKDGEASMDVRLGSLFKVQYQEGKEMNIAETVTYFNDLCVFAPGALPFKDIQWEELDSFTIRAVFTDSGIAIRADLHFNDHYELVDFESDDRYYNQDDQTMKKIKWSTPLREYKTYHGFRLASKAEAVWHFPDEALVYARFDLEDMTYNPNQ
jgi:hypothetical protein